MGYWKRDGSMVFHVLKEFDFDLTVCGLFVRMKAGAVYKKSLNYPPFRLCLRCNKKV